MNYQLRFYRVRLNPFAIRKRKEIAKQLNDLDWALLKAADKPHGEDILGLISASRPYVDKKGVRRFATMGQLRESIAKLTKFGLIETR
jgi:hypothetical protein